MTMRDHDLETQAIDPIDTDIGSGAPPEYAGQDIDVRDERFRDERMPPPRYEQPPYDPRYDTRYDARRDPRWDDRGRPRRYEDDGPGFADEAARFARRHLRTPETKEFFKTSELAFTIIGSLMLMVAASVHEIFDAEQMWPLVTLLFAAYIVSRGIAKAGVRHHDRERGY